MAKAKRPEPTPFERFEAFTKKIVAVPKKEIEKAELRRRKERDAREADRPK